LSNNINYILSLKRQYNIHYYVDNNWDLHLYQEENLEDTELELRLGEEMILGWFEGEDD